eukprot:Colp12_sorted_trinity150504_noHs@10941
MAFKTLISVLVFALLVRFSSAGISATTLRNISYAFADEQAAFGSSFPIEGLVGTVVVAEDPFGCAPIRPAPANQTSILLLSRGVCRFDEKVLNAQEAGYAAAIVADDSDGALLVMYADRYAC